MSDNCEFCGYGFADEHYFDDSRRLTEAHKTFGSIYVCDECIVSGLKLLQDQLKV